MRYAKIVFDTKELMQDAPRKELAAAGAACETGPARERALFVSADPETVDAAFAAGFPTPAPRTICMRPMNWSIC